MARTLFIALVLWMIGCTYCYVCHIKNHCYGQAQTAIVNQIPPPVKKTTPKKTNAIKPAPKPAPTATATNAFVLKDGNFSASSNDWAMFDRSKAQAAVSPNLKNAFKQTAQHLKNSPNRQLTITGSYANNETNNTWYDNLGIARAEAIKKEILGSGVAGLDGTSITTTGKLDNGLVFNGNKTNGNIRTAFSKNDKAAQQAAGNKKLTDIEGRLKAAPKNFYFDSGSSVIALDQEMRTYFRDLKYYLSRKPNAKITLTGHTDTDGAANKNVEIGQSRAERIKKYMNQNGINGAQISTTSKGESAPIATNNTPDGKAKNRRVEIRLN